MFQLRNLSGLRGEEDRPAAASYCGQKYGITSANFAPCVAHYVNDRPGDFVPGGSAPTTSQQPTSSPPTIPTIPFPNFPGTTTQMPTPGTTVTMTPPTGGFFAPGWYMTIPGIALIAAGAFVGYKLYTRKKPA